MNKITLFPCAKINLGLNITRKRSDGYHDLETVFCPVPIADILTIEKNGKPAGCSLKTNGIVIDGRAEDNIIVKAYDEMARRHTLTGVDITITKNIPIQAGMGGGSADCAFTIKGLNQLFSLNLTDGEMRDIAKGLGADCAFFINPTPAYATGIGEKLTPVDIPLDNHWIVIVKTDTAVSTREAFAGICPHEPERNCLDIVTSVPPREWKDVLYNDFEETIFKLHPTLAEIKQRLYEAGACYACMSGSGSAVVGLFDDRPSVESTDRLRSDYNALVATFKLGRQKDNAFELLPLVDAEGRVTGKTTRSMAHCGTKLLHPVVHLHVFDTHGNLYLQKRPAWKDIQPDRWDTAVGGHIGYGESVEEALQRETREEISIADFSAEKIDAYVFESRYEREYVNVFKTVYDKEIRPSENELDGGRFWSRDEILSSIGKGVFTPNFESEYVKYLK